jgi:hypothetical protein
MAIDIHIATSTVAMSIYNLVAFAGRPMTLDEMLVGLKKVQFYDIELDDLVKPIEELARRGWMVANDGRFEIVDNVKRRLIRSRDRFDFAHDDDGHESPFGGWNGWTTACDGCPGAKLDDIAAQEALR